MPFLVRTAVTAASLAAADYLLPGIRFSPPDYGLGPDLNYAAALVLGAVALGILNAFVKPVLVLLSLPITCLTLGLFIVVINGIMLWILSLVPFIGFRVDDPIAAILGGLIVSVVSLILHVAIPG